MESKRFKELCGITENEEKKQLKNKKFNENFNSKILKEVDESKFNIIKFDNDGLGEKTTEEEEKIYKMQSKQN